MGDYNEYKTYKNINIEINDSYSFKEAKERLAKIGRDISDIIIRDPNK